MPSLGEIIFYLFSAESRNDISDRLTHLAKQWYFSVAYGFSNLAIITKHRTVTNCFFYPSITLESLGDCTDMVTDIAINQFFMGFFI